MDSRKEVQHVYLVGAKSLGAYGGYETFVYKLTEYHQNKENIKYHVACKANGDGCMDKNKFEGVTKLNDHEFELHNAHCFKINIPQIGPAQAIYYDVAALKACCEHIRKNHIPHPIVYIMACRIGPFAGHFYKEIHKLGGKVYLNPDGHEWMRAKWSAPIRKYWKISEQMMVKYCDLAICDSVNIEKYIHECYDGKGIKGRNPKTTFIAYGADLTLSKLADDDEKLVSWYKEKGLTKKNYYLVVGRFVPENSFEVMIREFMKSNSQKDFALITNVNDKFLNELEEKLHFKSDNRIKFVGTVYDQELLKKIRENAYAYFHGHTVGGTNPSLIEALGSTDLNLLVDVGFNKEVAEDCALYWSRKQGSLAKLIDKADQMSADEIAEMGRRAKKRVAEEYTWDKICGQYESYGIDMALDRIIREDINNTYRPLLWKSFAYSLGYFAKDLLKNSNINSTMVPDCDSVSSDFNIINKSIFQWNKRIRIPNSPFNNWNDFVYKQRLFKALACHKSQFAAFRIGRVWRGDEVYWERRTDSVLSNSEYYLNGREVKSLSNFCLYKAKNFSSNTLEFIDDSLVFNNNDELLIKCPKKLLNR